MLARIDAALAHDAGHSLRAFDSGTIILHIDDPASTARREVLERVHTLKAVPNPLREGHRRRLRVDGAHAHRCRAELLRDALLGGQGLLFQSALLEAARRCWTACGERWCRGASLEGRRAVACCEGGIAARERGYGGYSREGEDGEDVEERRQVHGGKGLGSGEWF